MSPAEPTGDLGRPIRVVLFRGPFLEPAARRLFVLLDEHPEVELVGGFCQATGEGPVARAKDAWRRRGALAPPLLAIQAVRAAARVASHPLRELGLRGKSAAIDRRTQRVPDIHAPEVLDGVRGLSPDLGVVYGGPILKPELFQIPRFGTLSIHHGRLPDYRGKKTTFWEMAAGEATAAVTIQRIDAGLDTGEIVRQGAVPIGAKGYLRVWREVQELGIELYLEAILQVKRGTATFRPQGGKGRLYRDPSWSQIVGLWAGRMRSRWR